MEHAASVVVDKFKGIAKSSQDFLDGLMRRRDTKARRHPIEILKRLQREAFSELMKLRDRQDKVERLISFYGTSSKGGPFREGGTLVRGEVDVSGALVMMDTADQQSFETFDRAGIRTGVGTRLTFESNVRESDTLLAEFVAGQDGKGYLCDNFGSSLSLAKVSYHADVNDWFSTVAIPIGAQCRDLGIQSGSSHQGKGLTNFSFAGPPHLNQHNGNGSAIGVTVRKSNIAASFGQLVSGLRVQPRFDVIGHCLSTFGQVVCQLPKGIKLSVSGVNHVSKSVGQRVSLGPLTVPISLLNRRAPEALVEQPSHSMETITLDNAPSGSIALVMESELDESIKIQGWIEMNNSDARDLQWSVTVSEDSEDNFGWGLSLSRMIERPRSDHFQIESYIKFNLGKRACLQPGFVYVMDGTTRVPAFMLRSRWSL